MREEWLLPLQEDVEAADLLQEGERQAEALLQIEVEFLLQRHKMNKRKESGDSKNKKPRKRGN